MVFPRVATRNHHGFISSCSLSFQSNVASACCGGFLLSLNACCTLHVNLPMASQFWRLSCLVFSHITRTGSTPLRGRTPKPLRGFVAAAAGVIDTGSDYVQNFNYINPSYCWRFCSHYGSRCISFSAVFNRFGWNILGASGYRQSLTFSRKVERIVLVGVRGLDSALPTLVLFGHE